MLILRDKTNSRWVHVIMNWYPDVYFGVFFFLLGTIIGSFLNVVISRLPSGISIVQPRSRCPNCLDPIRCYDNIPIVSWLLLRGRCRNCQSIIPIRYPIVEGVTGGIALALYYMWGISLTTIILFCFSAAMIAVFWIDIDHMIIPDVISVNGIVIGFIAAQLQVLPWITWKESGLGFLLGGGTLYVVAVTYQKLRGREGLGGGDIKLLAMIGAFTGPYGVMFVLFLASLLGSVAAVIGMALRGFESTTPIPFGPFLAGSAVLFLFVGEEIVRAFYEISSFGW